MTTASHNGAFPRDARSAARIYLEDFDFLPIPVVNETKKPVLRSWQRSRPSPKQLDGLFPPGQPLNVGLLLGEPSGGLIDIDLDSAEAVAAAPILLPPTDWVSGRPSNPNSHWWYRVEAPPKKGQEKFADLDDTDLLEVRSTGGQTVAPPSVHESGERIVWYSFGRPAEVDMGELLATARSLAACALLARHWPGEGTRQDAAMYLAGALTREGLAQDQVADFLRAICEAAGDPEVSQRLSAVKPTARKVEEGRKTTGWPSLIKLLGEKGKEVVARVRAWLGFKEKTGKKGPKSAATKLVEMTKQSGAFLFHTADQDGFVTIPCDGHTETWPLKSTGFRRWLARRFYESENKSASGQAVQDALNVLEGFALFEGPKLPVHVRLAQVEGRIYLDLGDAEWQAVEVDAAGWRVEKDPPVKFRRSRGMLPLPVPANGGSLDELRRFLNLATDADWALLCGWMAAALRQQGPFPALALSGEQGTAKTTVGKLVQMLIDPNEGELRSEPQGGRDLMIAATNSWLIAYDNLSHLPQWLSDALCRLATGGGFSTRMLYTDDEERIFSARRPVLLTSIGDVVTAGDLLDRTVGLQLEPIPEDRRIPEAELLSRFQEARPRILGALLDLVSAGLRTLHSVRPPRLPRMADFGLWAEACLRGGGNPPGTFLKAYEGNRGDVNVQAIEASLVATAVLRLVEEGFTFQGTATDLMGRLNEKVDEATRKQKGWPTKPHVLSGQLRKAAPNLRQAGVLLDFSKEGKARQRTITIGKNNKGDGASAASVTPTPDDGHEGKDKSCAGQTGGRSEERGAPAERPPPSSERPPPAADNVGADAVDPGRTLGGRSPSEEASAPTSNDYKGLGQAGRSADAADAVSHPCSSPGYFLVRDTEGLRALICALDESVRVGLDTETTGLDWRTDKVRLLSLAPDRGGEVYLVDVFAVDPSPLFDLLGERELVGHNLAFDLAFLRKIGLEVPGRCRDLMILSRLLTAGKLQEKNDLKTLAKNHLGWELGKDYQRADWSGRLEEGHLRYAALDATAPLRVLPCLEEEIARADLGRVADIEQRCLPAWVWMSTAGVLLDKEAWKPLADEAEAEKDALRGRLDDLAPDRPGALFTSWNWNSNPDCLEALKVLGIDLADTREETLARADHPLASTLRQYRHARWLASTYGHDFLRHVAPDGRVYATWKQTGNVAGRSSCEEPNLQQIPRDDRYRRCFLAPEGRVLVKADFAAAHLRIAAKVANEARLIETFRRGEDPHALTARAILGKAEITRQDRQLAKAVNFGLLYAMGPAGLCDYAKKGYGVDLSPDDARGYRNAFFKAYPGFARWHRETEAGRHSRRETRTAAGRRRWLDAKTPLMHRLNSPVLGGEADAAKLALALLWERRGRCPGGRPVLFVHDEVVLEAPREQAEAAAKWVRGAMTEALAGFIDPVPVEVGVTVGPTWAG